MRQVLLISVVAMFISGPGCPSLEFPERDRRDWRHPWEYDEEVYVDSGGGDVCASNGWYGDGLCDEGCLLPDPDCDAGFVSYEDSTDWCAVNGWYGDGICDTDCPSYDWDCDDDGWMYDSGDTGGEDNWDDGDDWDDGSDWDDGDDSKDWCQEEGAYGDGYCDDCPSYDTDCEEWDDQGDEDWCEINGWYGDGYCDSGCPSYDWDCDFF